MTQTLIPSTAIEVVEQIEAGLFPTQSTDNLQFFNKVLIYKSLVFLVS